MVRPLQIGRIAGHVTSMIGSRFAVSTLAKGFTNAPNMAISGGSNDANPATSSAFNPWAEQCHRSGRPLT